MMSTVALILAMFSNFEITIHPGIILCVMAYVSIFFVTLKAFQRNKVRAF